MTFLLVLCIVAGALILLLPTEYLLFVGIALAIICISIMIYVCYKKLQSIEAKIDELNETDDSDNNKEE